MKQRKSLPACGREMARFFQCACAVLMLTAFSAAALAEKVNLNTADTQALQYIPGIGPGKASEIIRIREQAGGFKTMQDLLAVPGIGEKTLLEVKKFGVLDGGVSTLTEEMEANRPQASAHRKPAEQAEPTEQTIVND